MYQLYLNKTEKNHQGEREMVTEHMQLNINRENREIGEFFTILAISLEFFNYFKINYLYCP